MMRWWSLVIPVGMSVLILAGCRPSDEILADDSRNPYVTSGLNYVAKMEVDAAIGAFEKALETNPKSVRSHFELGLLYEKEKQDFVTAIYHYQRVLKLKPTGWPTENVKSLIYGCRQELVKNEVLTPIVHTMKRNIESLKATNGVLLARIDVLQTQLAQVRSGGVRTPSVREPSRDSLDNNRPTQPRPTNTRPRQPEGPRGPYVPVRNLTGGKVHPLQKNETLYSIARKYGISLPDLLRANPGIKPNNLPIGYKVKVPTR